MDDHVLVKGTVKVRKNGKVVYAGRNLVVNAGLVLLTSLISGSGTVPGYMAAGDSGTDPTGGDTALVGTEITRVTATKTAMSNTLTYSANFTGHNVGTVSVREFGIFNASSTGTMLARFICPEIIWLVADTLMVDWTINIGELS